MDKNWSGLDNAALIFPSASEKADHQVFRVTCELYDQVDSAILQKALEQTLESFQVYRSVLKRGMFWYYLEGTEKTPVVHEENRRPCSAMNIRNGKSLLFDVSYYHNRVNLEVYHVLSDGTGALNFLRTLITKYLTLRSGLAEPSLDYDASATQRSDDSFHRYYSGASKAKRSECGIACRLSGWRYPENGLKIITGLMNIQPILEAAHKYHTTLTVFLCACLMDAISETVPVRAKKRPVVLSVPVNLRSHFPSASARNFFSVLFVRYDYGKRNAAFEDVVKKIGADLSNGLARDNLSRGIDAYSAMEHNAFARVVPLYFKDLILKAAYRNAMRRDTADFSNLGVVSMPHELEHLIRSFDVCASTNKLQACTCTYQGRLSIGFSSPFVSAEIQRRFFRTLAALGAEVEITANPVDDGREKL